MIKESNILGNLGIALGQSSPEVNDSRIIIPPLIVQTFKPIQPTLRLQGSGATSETSTNVAISINRTNVGAANNTIITFTRGYYELDIRLDAKMNFSGAAGLQPIINVYLLNAGGGAANPLISFYSEIGVQSASRNIAILFAEDGYFLRLAYGAVGVGENLDAYVDAQITKFL